VKSFIAADVGGAVPRYRLLETTRAYALERLLESGELEQVERRHAAWLRTSAKQLAAYDRPIEDGGAVGNWVQSSAGCHRSAVAANPLRAAFHL
jgi:hypothetical protein